jgi:xylose isomerase
MQEKVRQFNDNKEIQDILKEIHGASPEVKGMMGRFSKDQAAKLKAMTFDADKLAARRLPYERLDQLVTELLLGVL